MTKEELKKLKENKEIKYIYKIPCSLFSDNYLYVIIGNIKTRVFKNIWYFSFEDWFDRINNHDILPYVCSVLSRTNKCKEYLNIYYKLDIIKFRKRILSTKLSNLEQCLQLSWAIQILKEGKLNRHNCLPKVSKSIKTNLLSEFCKLTDPRILMNIGKDV